MAVIFHCGGRALRAEVHVVIPDRAVIVHRDKNSVAGQERHWVDHLGAIDARDVSKFVDVCNLGKCLEIFDRQR
jgi:hypothetical protein